MNPLNSPLIEEADELALKKALKNEKYWQKIEVRQLTKYLPDK